MLFQLVACILFSLVALLTASFKDTCWLLKKINQSENGLKKLPWKAKPRLQRERVYQTDSGTGVKNDFTFCLGPPIEKTNSGAELFSPTQLLH